MTIVMVNMILTNDSCIFRAQQRLEEVAEFQNALALSRWNNGKATRREEPLFRVWQKPGETWRRELGKKSRGWMKNMKLWVITLYTVPLVPLSRSAARKWPALWP